LTDEARTMLKDFYKQISLNGFSSPRILITLFKLAKAIARLKLKEFADETDEFVFYFLSFTFWNSYVYYYCNGIGCCRNRRLRLGLVF
jgi:hypothetical protein